MSSFPEPVPPPLPGDLPALPEAPPAPAGEEQFGLPGRARLYLVGLGIAAAGAAGPYYARLPHAHHAWAAFAVLALAASVTQLFPVRSPRNSMYHTSTIFLLAGALLLPPEQVVLMPLAQTLPEWLKERYPWPIQGFNLSNYTLNALAAWGTADLLQVHAAGLIVNPDARFALAGLAGSVAWVASNHVLVAVILKLGRNHSFSESGVFSLESISIDLVLAVLGVSLAAFWTWNPWLVFAALAPLVVVHRSLTVPQLQAEARVDSKTGLYNARYFAAALETEVARAARFERPMAVVMADLDLLREINNSYGHLAGDAVLRGVARIFQRQLRHYDVAARFGGEEFSLLLPETTAAQALEIAERIRRAVAEATFELDTAAEPIRATLCLGVAAFPQDGADANELIHQADLAVYRAKLQGRNRVVGATGEPVMLGVTRAVRLESVREDVEAAPTPLLHERREPPADLVEERRRNAKPRTLHAPTFFTLRGRLAAIVATVSVVGIGAGALGLVFGASTDVVGLLAVMGLVGVGQALSLEVAEGSISVSAVGSLAGAALFDYRAALPLALTSAIVDWSARRNSFHHVIFNIGTLSLSSIGAAAVFAGFDGLVAGRFVLAVLGLVAGGVYFLGNTSLVSVSSAVEGHESARSVFQERFAWLAPHYLVYGFIGSVIAIAYDAIGLYALAVFAVPLLLMRKTQESYLKHTQRSTQKLREASETIQEQNVSLEQANRLLRERSTAAMASLSATVDARDAYTAGHSRRVQQLALAIGRELELSQAELDLLDRAALFHDIGKLAVPDAVLLKPGRLSGDEWLLMQQHAEEGARIIERLGFLQDAVPAIRHHHERWDGTGYPSHLGGDEIPLGARIIHVADALDSMLTTRIYRPARCLEEALEEVRRGSGTQFCPRCVTALERLLPLEASVADLPSLSLAS
jgi:diguanylate cyclase (GGDEF)-like protein/putative nucleotidyltransferase with HDIG domain